MVPVGYLLHERGEFGGADLPILTVVSEYGVRVRDLEAGGRAVSEDLSGYRRVRRGDLVVNRLWARFGAYGVSEFDGLISPAYWVLKPDTSSVDGRFLHSLLRSSRYLAEIRRLSKDMPPNGFDLPWDLFKRISIDLPPLPAQRAIADYLDAETARIDALIAKKQRMIELLLQRHLQRVRDLACGEGSERPLRRVVSMVKTGTTPRTEPTLLGEGFEWVTPGDFADGLLLLATVRGVAASAVQTGEVPLFPAGSVLVVGIGATVGKVAYADRPVSSNQQVTAVVPGPDVDGRFLAWQLWSRVSELRDAAPYTTLPILNNEFLRSFPVAIPDLRVQREAAGYFDESWTGIQALQTRLRRQVDLLREHRQALITAAVTGELEIPGVAA